MKTIEYLDRLAVAFSTDGKPASPYAISVRLGIAKGCVYRYLNHGGTFDESVALRVAEALDINPAEVLSDMAAERAKDPAVRRVWQRIARQVAKVGSRAALFLLAAGMPLLAALEQGKYILCQIACQARLYVKRARLYVKLNVQARIAAALLCSIAAGPVYAADYLTLAVHGLSHHFGDVDLRERNPGLGLGLLDGPWEYLGGFYRNSRDRTSVYGGIARQACAGWVCGGASLMIVTGYEPGPVPVVLPYGRLQHHGYSLNLALMPPIHNHPGFLGLNIEIPLRVM